MDMGELLGALVHKIETWLLGAVRLLPNVLVALLLLAAAFLLARFVYRWSRRWLDRTSRNAQLNHLGASLARLAILGGAVAVALSVLGLDKAVTSLLAGVGVLGIILGFALQESGANLVSGIYMAVRQPFKTGEIIKTGDYVGTVEDIDLRATTLRQLTGERVLVPNKDVFGTALENWSVNGSRRIDIELGVTYDADLDHVRRVTIEAATAVDGRIPDKPPEVLFTGFGASSVDLVLRVWAAYPSNREWLEIKSDLVVAIYRAYAEAGIEMPYPTLTLDLPKAAAASGTTSEPG